MRSVTIKRATDSGISTCYGELYEYKGFQFCITNSFDSCIYYAIEVSTGMSAHKAFTFEYVTEQSCINSLKRWIRNNINKFNKGTFERSKRRLSSFKIEYPLNDRIWNQ